MSASERGSGFSIGAMIKPVAMLKLGYAKRKALIPVVFLRVGLLVADMV